MAAPAAATATKAIPSVFMSNLDLDNAEDDGGAEGDRAGGGQQDRDAPALVHGLHVARVDHLDHQQKEEGQASEDPGRDATLGGEDLHLAADLLAGPDEVGQG